MYITRFYNNLENYIQQGKVLILYGPRQVGKTTLIEQYLARYDGRYKIVAGDDIVMQEVLGSQDLARLKAFVDGYDLLVIDEAQKIEHIGISLKLLVDHCKTLSIVVTGSSSFELAGQIGEPLTGRKTTLTLYPLSQGELLNHQNRYELDQRLSEWLVFGSYPEVAVATQRQKKISLLEELAHSYLLKDILALERVKSSKILLDILRLLAFQIGREVSLSEIAKSVQIDGKTVARYLDLFEKAFVLFNVGGFSRNLRKEVTKKSKYYFYDLGLRNAIISNFNDLHLRDDHGVLWENFCFIERLKKRVYTGIYANMYFWRTWDKKEIDLIEERDGNLYGYEFKWGPKAAKEPKEWSQTYANASFETINTKNYQDFIV
jgi:uncharacterized protein